MKANTETANTITLNRPSLKGYVAAIPAKAEAHRALICAALADRPTYISRSGESQDIAATCRVLASLGVGFTPTHEGVIVTPLGTAAPALTADCGESGSTLRFLLPLAAALCPELTLTLHGRLAQRPLAPLTAQMAQHGATVTGENPLRCIGRLQGGDFILPGNISSQFASGLLLALSRLGGTLTLTGSIESRPYLDMTVTMLRLFGADIHQEKNRFSVLPQPKLVSPGPFTVGGDWSDAAFFLTAGLLGKAPVSVSGLQPNSPQGDKDILPLLKQMGGRLEWEGALLTAYPSALRATTFDVAQHPDLAPILAVAASGAEGISQLRNAGRLRLKESDRLTGIANLLAGLGGQVQIDGDSLLIQGGPLTGGQVDGQNDHRLVMSAAIAACRCTDPVTISDFQAVNKSHPSFWEDFRRLNR